ncbi:hypothetical protein [Aeromicrobium sp. Root495]|uniref:hypothetical protein n=1 Tax=Aeromicrobium sp. Root495 TaxID=1736550 RepID=UPI0012E877FD|nr:hypothetical protein [Aeromicrobium sp. Root495]
MRRPLIGLLLWTLLLLALGVVAALLWKAVAEPSAYVVTERGAVLTEEAIRGQFQVVAAFMAVGALVSLVWGGVVAVVMNRLGWALVPWFVVATLAAGGVAWRLGTWWGPSDPTAASVRGLSVGDEVPSALQVDTLAPFLAWPAGALLALLVVTYLSGLRSTARPPR